MKIGPVSLLGVGTGYGATLMSGGSHRLWNQLLHATLFRSASLFRWRTRRLAFQSRVQFSPLLQNPAAHQKSLSLSLSALDRVSTKKKDLFRTGRNCSKRRIERSDQSRLRSTRVYKNAAIILSTPITIGVARVSRKRDPNSRRYVLISFDRGPKLNDKPLHDFDGKNIDTHATRG